MTADDLKRILADDAAWVVPCAKCGEGPTGGYFHVPASECPRKGGCLCPEDHHEYVAATKGSTVEQQACFDRRALIAAYVNGGGVPLYAGVTLSGLSSSPMVVG